jgi:hypothetical protein
MKTMKDSKFQYFKAYLHFISKAYFDFLATALTALWVLLESFVALAALLASTLAR